MNILSYAEYLSKWIKKEVKNAKMKGVILGMSGGVDSSVVAFLAKKAFPNNSLGIVMPINDMGQDFIDALDVAKKIKINTKIIDLKNSFETIRKTINSKDDLAVANIKPRLRMITLYTLAQQNKYLVLGTDNRAEWELGYFTKYGDGGVDLLPIVHLKKSQVKELAKYLKMPENIYKKKPSAQLWENQTDEEELGFSYDDVDKYLNNIKIDHKIKRKIILQKNKTNHKRLPIPIPKKFD